jgi:hypothetical protein
LGWDPPYEDALGLKYDRPEDHEGDEYFYESIFDSATGKWHSTGYASKRKTVNSSNVNNFCDRVATRRRKAAVRAAAEVLPAQTTTAGTEAWKAWWGARDKRVKRWAITQDQALSVVDSATFRQMTL